MPPFRSGPNSNGPPKDYIPGVGRGAAGFTTRSDVGPAATDGQAGVGSRAAASAAQQRQQHSFGDAPAGYVAGRGRGVGGPGGGGDRLSGETMMSEDPLETAAAEAEGQYDQEDDEADAVWDAIDARVQSRRQKRKQSDISSGGADGGDTTSRAKIRAQFRELKEQLGEVTEDEWAKIPDVGDYSLKYKQNRKQDVFTPLSDSLLEQRTIQNRDATAGNQQLASTSQAVDSNSGYKSVVTNMSGLSAARGAVLGMSLDKTADAVGGATTTAALDTTGYLTSLSSRAPAITADLGDISKARLLLKSVRDTNPQHGPGWIAASRVEEAANKPLQARKIIQEGCEACPLSEDVWLEAARLHPPDVAKRILATAARKIPSSVPIFLKAADLEHHPAAKKAVLRKALEANPTSITLWKAAIDLEEADDARLLLSVAVENVPHSVELWLALARLETYENAQKVLNKARKVLKADRSVWIAAAKLEEGQNKPAELIDKIMHRAVTSLSKNEAAITRAQWLEEAEKAESANAPLTSAAIVKHTIAKDVEEQDQLRTWTEDAKSCLARGSVATARAIIAHALGVFPNKRALWMQSIQLERQHGTAESLDNVLAEACQRLPHIELFWLLRAKERWLGGHVDKARQVLSEAFKANPDSETVWLAAAKLELENGETERARVLLQRARERAPTARAFMKSALLEWEEKNWAPALELIDEGIKTYPTFAKLYMMGGQICSDHLPDKRQGVGRARIYYQNGVENCPENTVLWILASQLEERAPVLIAGGDFSQAAATGGFTKARSLLELSRLKNPRKPELWLEAVRLERRAGNPKLADTLMAKALQECPSSGILLAEQIRQSPRVEKKSKSANAIKRCPEDPHVITAVAELFASERKTDKARKWFDRAVLLNSDLGDSWVRYYAFLHKSGTTEELKQFKDKCVATEPKHGEIWTRITKDMEHRHKTVAEHLELAYKHLQSLTEGTVG
ncbi:hypothetical protein ACA910_020746 [Epithemia clementina (nom. ined.)]